MALRFITWDVEHGSAAYIRTPNSKHIAIDLGARRQGDPSFKPLGHLWHQWGIRELDIVVITHPHLDHIEDMLNFDPFSPKLLIRPNHLTENEVWGENRNAAPETKSIIQKYIEVDKRYSQHSNPATSPAQPNNNGGVGFDFFYPTKCPRANVNNHSVVTVMTYAGVKFLLPGDNEPPSWEELLKMPNFVQAIRGTHVLVAPHHGRESGFHRPLFQHISPLLTLISDGRVVDTSATNRYTGVSSGWDVNRRSGGKQRRYCVTTRSDGAIDIEVNPMPNQTGSLKVTVN